jgi:P27 family predicted phage terminase small subunit
MPTPPVSASKMAVGKKSGGKHWTKKEVESAQVKDQGLRRSGRVVMVPPPWLSEEGLKVWKRVRRQLRGLELLDSLNTEMLAVYCDAVARYQEACEKLKKPTLEILPLTRADIIKEIQAWARLISSYAEKLGFTPGAKARLAKKKDDAPPDAFEKEFDG